MKELRENPPDIPSMIEGGFTGNLSKRTILTQVRPPDVITGTEL